MSPSAYRRERPRGKAGQEGRFFTPAATPLRQEIERRSAPVLLRIREAPRWLVLLVPVALLLAGLAAPSVIGGVAMLVLVVLLGWLGYLSWPSLSVPGRLIRSLSLLVLVALAVLRLLGRI